MKRATVLVVEDDVSLREALCDTLTLAGYGVLAANDGNEALTLLAKSSVQMVVSDVQMQPMDGHELLANIKSKYSQLPVVLITAYGTIEKAVQAIRQGAADYLVKPFAADSLLSMIDRLIAPPYEDTDIVASDPKTCELIQLAQRVAATDTTVMIMGESGTGKEVFARHIHQWSKRAAQPFVAINCAAIPENMLEAVLFGYEKGAFTGAYQSTPGKFEQAQGGTLLLDEVSEMEMGLQAKLLRVLQEKEVERIGGRKLISLDVRVLATTNRNLREHVARGKFREDLFYRLNVFPLSLPPLRSRRQDILPLAMHLLQRRSGPESPTPVLSEEAKARLSSHRWPGNVRELDNVIQRALILRAGPEIDANAIQFELLDEPDLEEILPSMGGASESDESLSSNLEDDLKVAEQKLIIDALKAGNGSRKYAAEKLGISPRTLRYKLAKMREMGVAVP